MFIFFPDEPKVGIKTIKQWVIHKVNVHFKCTCMSRSWNHLMEKTISTEESGQDFNSAVSCVTSLLLWPFGHTVFFNPLSPSIHIQILQTGLHTFRLRISWENLIKHQGIFSFVFTFYILTTLSFDNLWTLLGENCCWSLTVLKGLKPPFLLLCLDFTQSCTYFSWLRPIILLANLFRYCNRMQEENITRAIIVVQMGMTPSAKQVSTQLVGWELNF